MPSILVVDDHPSRGPTLVQWLEDAGHAATLVCEESSNDMFARCLEQLSRQSWDVLILDINFGKCRDADPWGGIWLFNRLRREGYEKRWRRLIVRTKYASALSWQASDGDQLVIRVFIDSAGIPWRAVLQTDTGGAEAVIAKVNEVLTH